MCHTSKFTWHECWCHIDRVSLPDCLHSTELLMESHWLHVWRQLEGRFTIARIDTHCVCLSDCLSVCLSVSDVKRQAENSSIYLQRWGRLMNLKIGCAMEQRAEKWRISSCTLWVCVSRWGLNPGKPAYKLARWPSSLPAPLINQICIPTVLVSNRARCYAEFTVSFRAVAITGKPCKQSEILFMCMSACVFVYRMHLYQWSDRVVRTVVRPDWKVCSGHVAKAAHMVVTPAVTVSVFLTSVTRFVFLSIAVFVLRTQQITYACTEVWVLVSLAVVVIR